MGYDYSKQDERLELRKKQISCLADLVDYQFQWLVNSLHNTAFRGGHVPIYDFSNKYTIIAKNLLDLENAVNPYRWGLKWCGEYCRKWREDVKKADSAPEIARCLLAVQDALDTESDPFWPSKIGVWKKTCKNISLGISGNLIVADSVLPVEVGDSAYVYSPLATVEF